MTLFLVWIRLWRDKKRRKETKPRRRRPRTDKITKRKSKTERYQPMLFNQYDQVHIYCDCKWSLSFCCDWSCMCILHFDFELNWSISKPNGIMYCVRKHARKEERARTREILSLLVCTHSFHIHQISAENFLVKGLRAWKKASLIVCI